MSEKKMKKYIKPSIKVRMIEAGTILAGSGGSTITTPIDKEKPATGPANGKGALFPDEETDEIENKSIWDD